MSDSAPLDSIVSQAREFGAQPLLGLPDGSVADLATGYIPLLVNFTFEDKAAKGLRKLKDQTEPEPAVYFSALEMVRDHPAVLLTGETGSGKTSFARHLTFQLAKDVQAPAKQSVVRNDLGAVHHEHWTLDNVVPVYLEIEPSLNLMELLEKTVPGAAALLTTERTVLLILDGIEAAGDRGVQLLNDALSLQKRYPQLRLLALGEISVVKSLALPAAIMRYDLLPLLKAQRCEAAMKLAGLDLNASGVALGAAAANPAQFVMAMHAGDAGDNVEAITDRWLTKVSSDPQTADFLCQLAFEALASDDGDRSMFPVTRVRQLLAARYLVLQPPEIAVAPFRSQPELWAPALRSLAARLSGKTATDDLIEALLQGEGDTVLHGALLAADLLSQAGPLRDRIADHLLAVVSEGALSAPKREQAARVLSCWGDPRDLQALADVPAGSFIFGSDTHPNSAPPHIVVVSAFRIGIYPVINSDYGTFVRETGRPWRSADRFAEDRRSAPATDLTWRDALAYCDWLTQRWHAEGRIAADEIVRLPTEPEWERAARGDQPDAGAHTIVYPWGTHWIDDAGNSEEAGFNSTCAVGLFPKGKSPYGCHDMAGQVWEWATTLWGDDMAVPYFKYPYRDDGREALDAGPTIRRVLRGGCFSSGMQKACCTYRGSLEPDGFWRGNGFRIVVSKVTA